MKLILSARSRAFTLIELLVVISIIALLAGMTFVGVPAIFLRVNQLTAKHTMQQVVQATELYFNEYHRYPLATGDADVVFGLSENQNNLLIGILRCAVAGSVTQEDLDEYNRQQIRYLQVMPKDTRKNAVNREDGNWYDPWGVQYVFIVDGNYNDEIEWNKVFTAIDEDSTGVTPVGVGAAAVGAYQAKYNDNAMPREFDEIYDIKTW